MVVGLATLFLWSPFWTSSEITATLLYRTDSWEEANRLGTAKSLTLIDYDGRIAVFAYEGNDIRRYLDAGFVFDSTLKTDGPPWSKPIVDDPYFSKQYAIALTNTDDAWNVTKGSIDVTVAIIDTGIDTNHPEFFGRLSELSFNAPFNQIGLTYVEDDYGHGTMVAGIIGANINNATGIAGLTNDVSLLIIKANQPGQETFKDSDIIRSIYYAVDHGANIINLSLGGTYANPLTEEAVRYAVSNNVLVIASSGNDGENIAMYPASFDQVISVGSVDSSSKRSLFSNYHERLDLVAPGTDIYTTAVDGKYTVVSGTSFSAPHVSGIAALYRSVYPDIDAMLLKMALESSARDLGETGFDWYYGHGLVDANKLLSIRYRIVTTHFPEGGSETYVVQDGLTVDLNPPPPYPNHEFVGWYLDAALSVSFDPRLPIQSDVDLYAAYGRTHVIVTWVIHENVFQTEVVPMGETPRIPEPMQTGMTAGSKIRHMRFPSMFFWLPSIKPTMVILRQAPSKFAS
jgi:subtilisin family serine protease